MSRVLLICPDKRPGLEILSDGIPLALAGFLGKPLIDHALDALAKSGVTAVRVLASDRPAEIRTYVMNGAPWGLSLEVVPEGSELTPGAAAEKHAAFQPDQVLTLDTLPQAPDLPVLRDAASWFAAHTALLPLLAPRQVGAREASPGIWLGLRARVHSTAVLNAPCWIGPHSIIQAGAVVGPQAFIEGDSIIDAHATVESSIIGARTYAGSMTCVRDSIAMGPTLLNWKNGSLTRITDSFLLSSLEQTRDPATHLPARLLALLVLILTSPILLLALITSVLRRQPFLEKLHASLLGEPGHPRTSVAYHQFPAFRSSLRRWPRLWRIVTGHFAWTGNPPLTAPEASALEGEFERLWLHTPPGLFTAPEAEGCTAPWDASAHAHAALFACQPTPAWRWRIIRHALSRLTITSTTTPAHEH